MGFRNNISNNCDFNMKILKLLPLIGVSILIYIIYKVGLINLYKTIITANLYYVFLSLLLLVISILALTFKWYTILKLQDININFLYALKLYFISVFYGVITPARTGSIIRASYLKDKTDKSFGACASSIILERLMDLFVIFVVSVTGCIVFSKYISSWLPIILVFFVVFILLSLLLLKKNINRLFFMFIYNFLIPERLKEKSREIYDSFYSNMPSIKKMIYPLVLTIATWTIIGVHFYFITRAYSVNISFFNTTLIFIIATMVGLIPITIGGLGTKEATLIYLFSFFGVGAATVVSISFLVLITAHIIPPSIGFFFSIKEPTPDKLI